MAMAPSDTALRLAIVRRLSQEPNVRLYLGTENKQGRWCPIEVAVRNDLVFFVRVVGDVFIADVDKEGCAEAAMSLALALGPAGFEPGMCDSGGAEGRQPRRHVWAVMKNSRDRERRTDAAKALRSDGLEARTLRPPGTLHRNRKARSTTALPATLATRWQVPVSRLANWRHERKGSGYIKIEGLVRYRLGAVEEWETRNESRTIETGPATASGPRH